jgi:hypothetical protein
LSAINPLWQPKQHRYGLGFNRCSQAASPDIYGMNDAIYDRGEASILVPKVFRRFWLPTGIETKVFHTLHRYPLHANSPSGSKELPPVSKLVQVRISEVRRCLKIL